MKFVIDPEYRFIILSGKGFYKKMPDKEFLEKMFLATMGYELDLDNPRTFNEKLQWLKLYDHNPDYTVMVDKYKVRGYIAERIGEQYLIPLIGVWDDPEDIDFDTLPDQFVLKCSHNSGLGMCICTDKSKLDIPKAKSKLKKGIKQNYFLCNREWPYRDVPHKIIAEKYMSNDGHDLHDYKVHCFNGTPKVILVCTDRFSDTGLKEDFYNTSWERLDLSRKKHSNTVNGIVRPQKLDDMLKLSEKLSEHLPFARIDFYIVDGELYFGEITLYPASGFEKFTPTSWDEKLGEWLDIPI